MVGKAPHSNVADDYRIAVEALLSAVQNKLTSSAAEVICIKDKEMLFESIGLEWFASDVFAAVNANALTVGGRTVILLQRPNPIEFSSALVRHEKPLQVRRNGRPIIPRARLIY